MDTELKRVSERIAGAILAFADGMGQTPFVLSRLNGFVEFVVGEVAPDSPGRILRNLRQQGKLNYRVIDRSQSLYEFIKA